MYPEEIVEPMRKETREMGFLELRTAEEVENALSSASGTTLVFINSVCGCAAGMARPGLGLALQNAKAKPDNLYTVFAGNDKEATEKARSYFHGYPPSSPWMGLIKDGNVVGVIQRLDIEGHSKEEVAQSLIQSFNTHCS